MIIIAKNKKARFEYQIIEKFEAGIKLSGSEVKSIKSGNISLKEAYIKTQNGELYLINAHVKKYEQKSFGIYDPYRPKKLLMHKNEISKLSSKIVEKGFSLIPLSIYLKTRYIKLELALAKGKKIFDKRESIKDKIVKRDVERKYKKIYK